MRDRTLSRLLVGTAALAMLFAAATLRAEDVDIDTRAKIEGYVKLLGADEAKVRDEAERALVAMGGKVRPFVEKALSDPSGEVRARAREVLQRLADAERTRTGEDQTWPGLRGGPTRSGVGAGAGELPRTQPKVAWAQPLWNRTLMQGALVPGGGYVACLSPEGVVRAFAASDGGRLWLADLGAPIVASGVLAAERLVVPTGKGVVAIDARDGREAWRFDAPYGAIAAPAIAGDRVYAAFRNFGVKAFDLRTGQEVFNRKIAPAGALLADGDLVVCGTEDGSLVRLDAATGRDVWRLDLGAPPNMGPTLAAPGVVVAFTRDRWLRAFSTAKGKELWRLRMGAPSGSESLGAAGGRVFLTDTQGWVHALDAATGRLVWHRNEGFVGMGAPCATGTAAICGSRGRIVCRDADCGDLLWRIDVPSADNASPAASGGRLFVLYEDELRCYE